MCFCRGLSLAGGGSFSRRAVFLSSSLSVLGEGRSERDKRKKKKIDKENGFYDCLIVLFLFYFDKDEKWTKGLEE